MNILRNVTEGISPLNWGGYKPGEMVVWQAHAQVAKDGWTSIDFLKKRQYYDASFLMDLKIEFADDAWTDYPKTTESLKRIMPKYKFSRKWHVAEYDWVHQTEVLEWCIEQFGTHPRNPDAWSRWVNKPGPKIHFRDEKDFVLFMLRWA